ncbi:MAG: hypothetical protein WC346_10825 [Methanogenium sp.]|jgi:hypothetical protein
MPIGKKTNFDPVPDGTYLLRVTDCVERSKRDDDTQVFHSWSFEVANECDEAGRRVNIAMPCDMAVGSKLEKMWLALGLPPLALGDGFDTDDAIGGEFYARIVVKQRKGNAGVKNEFETIWSIEEYEKEIAKATAGRRPASKPASRPAAQVTAQQESEEGNDGSSDEGSGDENPEQAPASPQRPVRSATPPQRPAGKSLQFPKTGSNAGGLKK